MEIEASENRRDRSHVRLRLKAIRFSRLKRAVALVAWLLFSVLATQLILLFSAEPILRTALPFIVNKKSNGIYTASFGHLSVSYTRRSLFLSDFRLVPNHKRYLELKKHAKIRSGLYEIHIPRVEVNAVSSYRLFYFKTLKMKELLIYKPRIMLADLPANKKRKDKRYDAVNKDLLPFVTKYVKSLEIDRIVVDNAYFDMTIGSLDQKTTVAKNLTLVLSDFRLNPKNYKKDKDKFLYAKDIDLMVKDYMFALPDRVHALKAKRIVISTKTGRLKAESVSILPLPGIQMSDTNRCLKVLVPMISIDGLDFKRAYADSKVKVNEFLLKSPQIYTYGFQSSKGKSSPKHLVGRKNIRLSVNLDLYKFIKGALKSVEIRYFNLSDARFSSFPSLGAAEPNLAINKFSIVFNRFFVDSLSVRNKKKIFNAEQFNINVHGFKMLLADGYHKLDVRRFYISSNEKVIFADEVEIMRRPNAVRSMMVNSGMEIFVPSLSIRNIDLHKAFNYSEIDIHELDMNKPVVSMERFKQDSLSKRTKRPLNDVLSSYFNLLKIRNLNLEGGLFEFKAPSDSAVSLSSGGRVSLHLSDLLYEPDKEQDTSKLFYAENFELLLKDYSLMLKDKIHNLHFGELMLSSEQRLFSVDQLSISPILAGNTVELLKKSKKSSLLDIAVEDFKCHGLDVRRMYQERKMFADSIIIKDPQIGIRRFDLNFDKKDTLAKVEVEQAYVFGARDSVVTDSLITRTVRDVSKQVLQKDSIDLKKLWAKVLTAFDEVEIGRVFAKNGSLRVEKNDSTAYAVAADNYNFCLDVDKLHLSSGFLSDSLHAVPAKDVKVLLKDFDKEVFKGKYRLSLNELSISTQSSLISGKIMRLQPTRAFAAASNKYLNLFVPDVKLYYRSINDYLHTRVLTVDSAFVESPRFILVKLPEKEAKPFVGDTVSAKRKMIPDIFKCIDIKHVELSKGMFAVFNEKEKSLKKNKVIAFNFDFNIDELPIDSLFLLKKFSSGTQLTGVVSNAFIKTKDSLHFMTADYIYLDTHQQRLDLLGYQLSYNSKLSRFQTFSRLEDFMKNNLLSIAVAKANFSGFDWLEAINKKGMSFGKANLSGLDVGVINYDFLRCKPVQKIGEFDLYELVRPITRYLNINELNFDKAGIHTRKVMEDSVKEFRLENAKGKISELRIDSLRFDRPDLLCSKDIQVEIPSYTLALKDSINSVRTGRIWLSTRQKLVKAEKVVFGSGRSLLETSELYDYPKAIFNVSLDSAIFHHADIPRLYDNKNFIASNGDIYGLDFKTFTNRKQNSEDDPQKSKSPVMMLKRAKFYWDIDSIKFHRSRFSYQELPLKGERTGLVFIDSIHGTLYNMVNDKMAVRNNLSFRADVGGRMFGEGLFNVSMSFPLSSEKDEFSISGSLENLRMTQFNAYVEPTQSVMLTGGYISLATFNFSGDSSLAKGRIKALYNGLKIDVLNQKKLNSKRKLTSLFANTLIRQDNPRNKLSLPRVGQIYLKRPARKSMINFWMRAVMVGGKSLLGFDSKEGKKERKMEHREQKKQQNDDKKASKYRLQETEN